MFNYIRDHRISRPTDLASASNKLKLLQAEILFMHSIFRPISDNSVCSLGERNFVLLPVPIISKSTGLLAINVNIDSFVIKSSEGIDISLN